MQTHEFFGKPPKEKTFGSLGSNKNKSIKARANKHEKEIAEELGGVRQPGSGARSGEKGDIKLDDFLLDLKETDAGSIIVSRKDLVKIDREAIGQGKTPGLVIKFNKIADGVSDKWVLIPIEKFAETLKNKNDSI